VIVATRKGIDPDGNSWEETIVRTGDETFRLEVRSDEPDDCFDQDMTLRKLFDYMRKTAVQPFVWAAI
jgi:hypothetical protein